MTTAATDLQLLAHLMRRAGFGASRSQLESLAEKGYDTVVDELLNPSQSSEMSDDLIRRYHHEQSGMMGQLSPGSYWIYKMATSTDALREKMSLFWHGIFATGYPKITNGKVLSDQIRMYLGLYAVLGEEIAGEFADGSLVAGGHEAGVDGGYPDEGLLKGDDVVLGGVNLGEEVGKVGRRHSRRPPIVGCYGIARRSVRRGPASVNDGGLSESGFSGFKDLRDYLMVFGGVSPSDFCGWVWGWLAGGRKGIVVSVRPGGTQLFHLLFRVLSTSFRACARARTVPGTPVGRMPVRSQVFERRLPPGPVAILVLTGLAVDALVLPLLMGV